MTTKRTSGKAKAIKKAVADNPTSASAELKGYIDGAGIEDDNFSFLRFYWKGEGERSGFRNKILKKLDPKPDMSEERFSAAKWELLLPARAPNDYMSLDSFLARYEEGMGADQANAFVQVTMRFPDALNLHHPYEMVRQFARSYFVDESTRQLPLITALHAPHLAASENAGHIHLVVFPRRLTPLGFGAWNMEIPNDEGNQKVYDAWSDFKSAWSQQWGDALWGG